MFCFPLWRHFDLFNKRGEYWLTVNGHIGLEVFSLFNPLLLLHIVTSEKIDYFWFRPVTKELYFNFVYWVMATSDCIFPHIRERWQQRAHIRLTELLLHRAKTPPHHLFPALHLADILWADNLWSQRSVQYSIKRWRGCGYSHAVSKTGNRNHWCPLGKQMFNKQHFYYFYCQMSTLDFECALFLLMWSFTNLLFSIGFNLAVLPPAALCKFDQMTLMCQLLLAVLENQLYNC